MGKNSKIITLSAGDDIQARLDDLSEPATIYLKNGVYRQKLQIKGNGVKIVGESAENTVITFDDYAKKIHFDGREFNTFRTYTVCVTGENVKLENLTVENSNLAPERVGQCVALSVNARRFSAENVRLKSTQDTLFLAPFPDDLVVRYEGFIPDRELKMNGKATHLFKNCEICGTVDFIFGCSEAYFKDCKIISLADARDIGFVAAPAHPRSEEFGFNFIDCEFLNGGARSGTVFLARPWRDFGKCAYINCKLQNHFTPVLFDKWNDTDRDRTARFEYFNLDCDFSPAPVSWCKRLSADEADNIIKRCEEKFKENMRRN